MVLKVSLKYLLFYVVYRGTQLMTVINVQNEAHKDGYRRRTTSYSRYTSKTAKNRRVIRFVM